MRAGSELPRPNRPAIPTCAARFADGRKLRSHAPLLERLQRERVDGDRIFAREKRALMHGVIRMRLRTTGVLRDQPVHRWSTTFFPITGSL